MSSNADIKRWSRLSPELSKPPTLLSPLVILHKPIFTLMLPLDSQDFTKQIRYVADFVGSTTSDWFKIKKELLRALPPKYRGLFTRRHDISRKFFLNDFELELMRYWESITGTTVIADPARLHTDADLRKPRHWGLMNYNRLKKEERARKLQELSEQPFSLSSTDTESASST